MGKIRVVNLVMILMMALRILMMILMMMFKKHVIPKQFWEKSLSDRFLI